MDTFINGRFWWIWSKKTHEIWEANEKKLIYFGRNFKIERVIRLNEDLRKAQRNMIDLFSIAIFRPYFNHCETQKNLIYLISLIDEDEVIVCDVHQKFNKTVHMGFIKEENISELFPSILCPSFKQVKINNKDVEPKKFCEHIKCELMNKAIIIEKESIVYSVFSSILRVLEDNITEIKGGKKQWNCINLARLIVEFADQKP